MKKKGILELARGQLDTTLIAFDLILSAAFILIGYLVGNNYFRGVGVGLLIAGVTSALAHYIGRKK